MSMKTINNEKGIMKLSLFYFGLFFCIFIVNSAVAEDTENQQVATNKSDPYESFNRKMFRFNDSFDDYLAKPVANGYKWITPKFMQTGVSNFFNNLENINVVINDVLQAKFSQSAEDTGRFAINSTLGLLGLVDVAKDLGLEQNQEDFDQTFAVWGVPQGSYVVLPIFGPSTARGMPAAVFDAAANPATYAGVHLKWLSIMESAQPIAAVAMIDKRANADGALKFIDEAALDPYVFTRESFLQWRNNLATDGKSEASLDLEDLGDQSLDGNKGSGLAQGLQNDSGKKSGFTLRLEADSKSFSKASQSFDSAAQSFVTSTKAYEEAGKKLDKFIASKKKRRNKD